jgi:hypothetical protein
MNFFEILPRIGNNMHPPYLAHKIFLISSLFFIFSNSGHVGWRSGLPDSIFEGDHPRTIPPKFGRQWPSGFREDFG